MSTPCCQSLRSNSLVVSEYEVPKVLSFQEWIVFFETPCSMSYYSRTGDTEESYSKLVNCIEGLKMEQGSRSSFLHFIFYRI